VRVRKTIAVAATLAAAALATACGSTQNVVDGKAVVEVPATDGGPAAVCYLLEIERQDSAGEDVGESYICVSRQEYDANNIDEVWVDTNGREK
jgi:hypothetical protein